MISADLRDFLIEHLDGPVRADGRWFVQRRAALARGLVRMERWHHQHMPRRTEITDDGRAELAQALADWADALTKTEFKL